MSISNKHCQGPEFNPQDLIIIKRQLVVHQNLSELTYNYLIFDLLILLALNKHYRKDISSQPRAYINQ